MDVFVQLGEVLYEERVYPPGKWACVSKADMLYEQSISNAFMKLMRFICKENSTGKLLTTKLLQVGALRPLPFIVCYNLVFCFLFCF